MRTFSVCVCLFLLACACARVCVGRGGGVWALNIYKWTIQQLELIILIYIQKKIYSRHLPFAHKFFLDAPSPPLSFFYWFTAHCLGQIQSWCPWNLIWCLNVVISPFIHHFVQNFHYLWSCGIDFVSYISCILCSNLFLRILLSACFLRE